MRTKKEKKKKESGKTRLTRERSNSALASRLFQLSSSILAGIREYGTTVRNGTTVYAYEVDGFGNAVFMDDGNVPSLMSLPLLGFLSSSDPVYLQTRRLLLSQSFNPFFFVGSSGKFAGVGSPHTDVGSIWPIGLIVQALTSTSLDEIKGLLEQLKVWTFFFPVTFLLFKHFYLQSSTAGTNFIHESFSAEDPFNFSRPWFAWANSLFGQLILDLVKRFPSYMLKP